MNGVQVSACVSPVLGNEPTELPEVRRITQRKHILMPTAPSSGQKMSLPLRLPHRLSSGPAIRVILCAK